MKKSTMDYLIEERQKSLVEVEKAMLSYKTKDGKKHIITVQNKTPYCIFNLDTGEMGKPNPGDMGRPRTSFKWLNDINKFDTITDDIGQKNYWQDVKKKSIKIRRLQSVWLAPEISCYEFDI